MPQDREFKTESDKREGGGEVEAIEVNPESVEVKTSMAFISGTWAINSDSWAEREVGEESRSRLWRAMADPTRRALLLSSKSESRRKERRRKKVLRAKIVGTRRIINRE